jgi:hypothetical protein
MTIDELAYLKCPTKIRAALINTTGAAPSMHSIEVRLKAIAKRPPTQYGKPDGSEHQQFRVRQEGVSDDPLLAALKREHPERFPPKPVDKPRGQW